MSRDDAPPPLPPSGRIMAQRAQKLPVDGKAPAYKPPIPTRGPDPEVFGSELAGGNAAPRPGFEALARAAVHRGTPPQPKPLTQRAIVEPKKPEDCLAVTAGFNPGPRPDLEWVPIDLLDVDHAYQRALSREHAKKLAAHFTWASFQPLSVARKANGRYAVVDGQHRLQAVKSIVQITELPCYVVAAGTQEAQAYAFVEINQSHKRMSGVEVFRAAIVAKDPATVLVNKALEDVGVKIVVGQMTTVMCTASPAGLVTMTRLHGIAHVRRGLGLMAAAWRLEVGAFSTHLTKAVILTCRYGGTLASDEAMLAFMRSVKPAIYVAEEFTKAKRAGIRGGASVLASFFRSVTGREFSRS